MEHLQEFLSGAEQMFSGLLGWAKNTFAMLLRHGYFDVSTLWRQFYDSSVSTEYLRWYNILIYILGCAGFLFFSRAKHQLNLRAYVDFLAPRAVRASHSVRIDLQWFAADLLQLPQLVASILGTLLALKTVPMLASALHIHLLGPSVAQLPQSLRVFLFYVAGFLSYEFGLYWTHRLQHYSTFLWQFHKVHHYSRQINVFTSARVHPVDNVLVSAVAGFCMGAALSVITEYDGINMSQLDALAKEYWWFWVLMIVPSTLGRFGHTHVPFSYGWADYVFISPAMHIVHHARNPELHDRNFGGSISLWDWIFGTAHRHDFSKPLELGIEEFGDDHYRHFVQSLAEPFLDAFKVGRERVSKFADKFS